MKSNCFAACLPLLLCFSALAQTPAPTPGHNGRTLAERLGYPANSRLLVIHADDFGMMHTIDRAIMTSFEHHWITSASIQVPCPWFPEVVAWAKKHPEADLGVHLTLNADWTSLRWRPISPQAKNSSLLDADGYLPLTTDYVAAHAKIPEVQVETHAQVDRALAAGIPVSHLDSHMGTLYSTDELFEAYISLGKDYHVPVRLEWNPSKEFPMQKLPPGAVVLDQVIEMRPGVPDSQWLATYKRILAALSPGVYELIVHLAYEDDEIHGATDDHPSWGAHWRQNDLNTVSNPEFQKFLKDQGFILVTWRNLAKAASTN